MDRLKDMKFRRDYFRNCARLCRKKAAEREEEAEEYDELADDIEYQISLLSHKLDAGDT